MGQTCLCVSGQVERKRPLRPGVPDSGSEGDMVLRAAVQRQRHCSLAEDGEEGE